MPRKYSVWLDGHYVNVRQLTAEEAQELKDTGFDLFIVLDDKEEI